MSAAVNIAKWVQKNPMIMIRLDEAFSGSLRESRQGFEHLTIAKPHSVMQGFKLPTLSLIEVQECNATKCYLGTVTRKAPVTLFDSRLTIKKLRPISPASLQTIAENVSDTRMKRSLSGRIPAEGEFALLSPKLSAHVVELLADDPRNQAALDTAFSVLPQLRRTPNANWAQEDAIQSALAVFGIRGNEIAEQVVVEPGASTGLGLLGARLYEDNVVHADASSIPGFEALAPDVTGRAVFQKRDERLVIFTANKLPLEEMLGVDLIYINETRGSIVMVQYKMLKPETKGQQDGTTNWIFRPDRQLRREIARMRIPDYEGALTDYRLCRSPFFFKFVKRKIVDGSHQSFLVSLEHLNQIIATPRSRGPKGGIRLSYEALNGTYLREADMISLIRSGYVGTHRAETEALAVIIAEAARGNNAVVLAWQQMIAGGGG